MDTIALDVCYYLHTNHYWSLPMDSLIDLKELVILGNSTVKHLELFATD